MRKLFCLFHLLALHSLELLKFYKMLFRAAASINEMFVYAWLRPAFYKFFYLIADRLKKFMPGIFMYLYKWSKETDVHAHVWLFSSCTSGNCAGAGAGDECILHFITVWSDSFVCHADLGIWYTNCNYFFPHSAIVALVFLSLVLHIIPLFQWGRLVALHFGDFFNRKVFIMHSQSSMHLIAVKKL